MHGRSLQMKVKKVLAAGDDCVSSTKSEVTDEFQP